MGVLFVLHAHVHYHFVGQSNLHSTCLNSVNVQKKIIMTKNIDLTKLFFL